MGKLYKFNFELYSDNTFTTKVATLGDFNVAIGEYTTEPTDLTQREITSDYNFCLSNSDTVVVGSPTFGYSDNQYIENLKSYIPLVPILSSDYNLRFNYLKITDTKTGFYATSDFPVVSSSTFFRFYDNDGVQMGGTNDCPFNGAIGFWINSWISGDRPLRSRAGYLLFPKDLTVGQYVYSVYAQYSDNPNKVYGKYTKEKQLSQVFVDWMNGLHEYVDNADPYESGGISGGGGGTGDFDDTSDIIGLPNLPSLSGLNTGFFTAFVPSASQMQSVSNYLWNNLITDILDPNQTMGEKIDALKKVVANPYDAIMGCSIIPVTPPTAGSKELKMYGLVETGITLPYASTRWVSVDCGTLNIHEFWGGYLDYSPYTKTTSLYLPYIGTVSIDIDLIMNKSLQVVYYVDILSGICVAFVLVDGSVKFHYQGQCATQVPITNADYSSTISAGIGLIGNVSQVVGSAVTGGVGGGVAGAVAGAVGGAISQAPSIASNVMGAKPDIRSGGSIGSSAGILSVQKPYLIIERPKQSLPERQNTFTGYPSNITSDVGSLSGYTEFESINLDGLTLTASEKDELESLLKGGVYL